MTPKYRADIDGLRAIAVLSIVLFHLDIKPFSGGYVGVDIFFVISGFLITSIIIRELAEGSFSIARFYERRVRRILPALITVLVATLAVGLVLLNPAQVEDLGKAMAATLVFSSNIFFFFGAGYFDGPSELKPLLHTWSLAVEEQYYIFFPFLLIFIARRFAGRYFAWLVVLGSLSLLACIIWTEFDEVATFYLIPFRAWELLIGSVLALKTIPPLKSSGARNLVSLAGLSMMLASVFTYTHDTVFPGAAAMLPTIGTGMVIYAGIGGSAAVNRLLGARALVFVGLISYSLYLWHWPMIVYAKYFLINELTDIEKGVVLIAMFLVATLSWRYVETPFRDRRRFAPRQRLFTVFTAVSGVLLAASLVVIANNGFPNRGTVADFGAELINDPGWQHWKNCEEAGEEDLPVPALCGLGNEAAETTFLFWGDSHALAMASAVNLSANRQNTAGLLAVRTGCPPLLSIDRPGQTSCAEFNRTILSYVAQHEELETIVLAARWALSTSGVRYKNENGNSVELEDLESNATTGNNVALFEIGLRRTVDALEALGRRVVLVRQIPEIGYDVPAANYSAKFSGRDVNEIIAPTIDEYEQRSADSNRVINAIRDEKSVLVVDPSSVLCGTEFCSVVTDGTPLYRDDNHLSLRGCVLISDLFDPATE